MLWLVDVVRFVLFLAICVVVSYGLFLVSGCCVLCLIVSCWLFVDFCCSLLARCVLLVVCGLMYVCACCCDVPVSCVMV